MLIRFVPARMAYLVLFGLMVAGNAALPVAAAQTPDASPSAGGTAASGATPSSTPATITSAMPCDQLAAHDFSNLADASVRVASAADVAATDSDPDYCEVAGTVASNAQFLVQLPSTGWT